MLRPYIAAILAAFVMAYIFFPVYTKISGVIKKKEIASIITVFILLILIFIPIALIFGSVMERISSDVSLVGNTFGNNIDTSVAFQKLSDLTGISIHSSDFMNAISSKMFEYGNNFVTSVPKIFLYLFVMLFIMYYLFLVGPELYKKVYDFFPFKSKIKQTITKDIEEITHATLYGNIITALAQGIVALIGYLIFGVSGAFFFAILTCIAAIIPAFGTAIVWVPVTISLFLHKDYSSGIGLLLYGVFCIGLIDNFLRPKIIGKRANMHPVWVLLGVIGGIQIFGIIGLFIGPIVVALLFSFVKAYHLQYNHK
jgi:predicted PurR-regulated permease PerM